MIVPLCDDVVSFLLVVTSGEYLTTGSFHAFLSAGFLPDNCFLIVSTVAPLSELTDDLRDETRLEPLPACEGG